MKNPTILMLRLLPVSVIVMASIASCCRKIFNDIAKQQWKLRNSRSVSYGAFSDRHAQTLQSILGEGGVSVTGAVRDQHSRDESHHTAAPPEAVVFPHSLQQVQEIVKLCNKEKIPLIPFGTGTGLEGGVTALKGGISVDLTKMDSIVEVEVDNFYCSVEPGVTRKTLNNYLRDTGLWFPVDPGADASLCGMAATNASGTNAVRYGTMRENVLNLQVVLADGSVVHTAGLKGRAKKRSAGYNLTNLFVGSEGTLGLITQTTLKLYGVPEASMAAVCSFPDVESAVTTTVQTLQSGIPIAKMEFLDDVSMKAANMYSNLNYPLQPTLFMEFSGSPHSVEEQTELVREIATSNGGSEFQWAKDHEERQRLWKARHDWYYAGLVTLSEGKKGYTTDVCVPISKLPYVLTETKKDLDQSPFIAPIVGHVGDGNFHATLYLDHDNKEELKQANEVAAGIARRALSVGGTCTGEHGIGCGKKGLLIEEMGSDGMLLLRHLKKSLDPNLILNPGKVLDV